MNIVQFWVVDATIIITTYQAAKIVFTRPRPAALPPSEVYESTNLFNNTSFPLIPSLLATIDEQIYRFHVLFHILLQFLKTAFYI